MITTTVISYNINGYQLKVTISYRARVGEALSFVREYYYVIR